VLIQLGYSWNENFNRLKQLNVIFSMLIVMLVTILSILVTRLFQKCNNFCNIVYTQMTQFTPSEVNELKTSTTFSFLRSIVQDDEIDSKKMAKKYLSGVTLSDSASKNQKASKKFKYHKRVKKPLKMTFGVLKFIAIFSVFLLLVLVCFLVGYICITMSIRIVGPIIDALQLINKKSILTSASVNEAISIYINNPQC